MKRVLLLGFLIILSSGAVAAVNGLSSYKINPLAPQPNKAFSMEFTVTSSPCAMSNAMANFIDGEIYVDVYISVWQICPTFDIFYVTLPALMPENLMNGLPKGIYPVNYRYVYDYDFLLNNQGYTDIDTGDQFLCNLAVGLPDIQTCFVEANPTNKLVQSGGIAGTSKNYLVSGQYSFAMTSSSPRNGWLTDVQLFAVGDGGEVIDIAELFGLTGAAVYVENATYTGETYYDGGKAEAKLIIDPGGNGYHLSGTVKPGCCDRFSYSLYTYADIASHSACKKFPASDLNKDCKVDLKDLAIMASEWLDCWLVYQEDCS